MATKSGCKRTKFVSVLVLRYDSRGLGLKKCVRCGFEKEKDAFYSGRAICIACRAVVDKKYRERTKSKCIWRSMMHRCTNSKNQGYKNYGGRGIEVCIEWQNHAVFHQWYISNFEHGKSIDRIDNDKGYSPANCRFATRSVQNKNKRPFSEIQHMVIRRAVATRVKKAEFKASQTLKKCPACAVYLERYLFSNNKRTFDGLSAYCRKCRR